MRWYGVAHSALYLEGHGLRAVHTRLHHHTERPARDLCFNHKMRFVDDTHPATATGTSIAFAFAFDFDFGFAFAASMHFQKVG